MTTRDGYPIPMVKENQYIIADTTMQSSDAMWVDELSGDYGDAGRKVYIAFKARANGNDPKNKPIPFNLDGYDVRLIGRDAKGVWKQMSSASRIINVAGGLVEMTVAREFYQAVGPYESAEFEIYEKNGSSVISTVKVGFEVYNNNVIMSVGESEAFISNFAELQAKVEKQVNDTVTSITTKFDSINSQIALINQNTKELKNTLDTWTNLVQAQAIPTLAGDHNIFTGKDVTFTNPVNAHVTGTLVKVHDEANTQPDLNDVSFLKDMPRGSTESAYYTGNKIKNNPLSRSALQLTSTKLTNSTTYQYATTIDLPTKQGQTKARVVNTLQSIPSFGPWQTIDHWSDWLPLAPYFTSNFENRSKDQALCMYKFDGNSVQFKGKFAPTKKLDKPKTATDRFIITKKLPFHVQNGQYHLNTWSSVHGYTLRIEDDVLFMERIFDVNHNLTAIDNTRLFSLGGSFALN